MKVSTSINTLFREHQFLERFAAARDAGFVGVEIQLLEVPAEEAAAAARAARIDVALINAPMGDLRDGGPGLSGVPGRETEFADAIRTAILSAKTLGVRHIHIGPSRVPEGESVERCLNSLVHNLEVCLPLAEAAGVALLVEPMNRIDMPNALIGDIDAAVSLIRTHFDGRLGLQFDIYHIAQNGGDPAALFLVYADLIKHIQFSDTPRRSAPGTGDVDFPRVFSAIRDSGYNGWAGAEYNADGPTTETLDWLTKYFERVLN